ncbi:MAG: SRPBCC family protein [Candidatus Saccharibacteria bacterium]
MDSNSSQAHARMMIRKPVAEVFNAFIDPSITKNFWFTRSGGKLELNKTLTWEWEMYNISASIWVKEILQNRKIVIEWGEPATNVEFQFTSISQHSTYVQIIESGYHETGDKLLKHIIDSTGGFTTVLDGLKAYLEHGINLNLIADKFPKEIMQH